MVYSLWRLASKESSFISRVYTHPPSRHRLVVAIVVVDCSRVVFGVFAGEAPGISRGRNAAGDRQRAERSVLVVSGNIVVGVNDFGDVLVAVVRVIRNGSAALPRERTRRHGLGRIPDEVVIREQ